MVNKFFNMISGKNLVVNRVVKKLQGLVFGKKLCIACNSRIMNFIPLPEIYKNEQRVFGYKYVDCPAETLNELFYTCPSCGASDRDRLMNLYIQENYLANNNGRVLHFAPAPSLKISLDKAFVQITADLYMDGVDVKVDICKLDPFKDNFFDLIICSHVLEHVIDDVKALSELQRVLKPGGKVLLLVPLYVSPVEFDEDPDEIREPERWRRFGQDDHIRLYNRREFIKRIESVGLKVDLFDLQNKDQRFLVKHGFSKTSTLYIASKK